jgi:glutamine cyclotransferase
MVMTACAPSPSGSQVQSVRPESQDKPVRLRLEVIRAVPHDRTAFTQGLELRDGVLYESTGRVGQSSLRATDPATGAVKRRASLPEPLFGEGLTVVGDHIWQLTWKNGIATRWRREGLVPAGRASYQGEGWGLCHDRGRNRLVMSDGSDRLVFRNPETFAEIGSVRVRLEGQPLQRLNELECTGDVVWANVWMTNRIVRIDPGTGRVTAVATVTKILTPAEAKGIRELNGIAHVSGTDTFYVTGKLWPKMFQVRFVPEG